MATISDGVTTISPAMRVSFADTYESRNVIHPLLGGGVAATFGAEPKRTGTLSMVFRSEGAANTAYLFFKNGYVFELVDDDAPTTNMVFVVAGGISRELNGDTFNVWQLDVDFQEVQQ